MPDDTIIALNREVNSATLPVMPPLYDFIPHTNVDDFNLQRRHGLNHEEEQLRFNFN
jgi:hypothetical protein